MFLSLDHDNERVIRLINMIGDILQDEEASNVEALLITLYIAVKVCDEMEMTKNIFLLNCDNMYDSQSINFMRDEGETLQ
jgi:hypothetical protein